LVEELHFDRFINYKDKDFEKELKEGVDCYFDNVGGEISNVAMERMNQYGRISVCGAISGYNSSGDVIGDWRRGESRSDLCCIFSRYGSALRRRQTIEDGGVRRKEDERTRYRTEQEVDQRGKDEIQGDYDGGIRQHVQGVC
jgi:NADPH:quinone reductase-like Zn-dependent oxidoreductase